MWSQYPSESAGECGATLPGRGAGRGSNDSVRHAERHACPSVLADQRARAVGDGEAQRVAGQRLKSRVTLECGRCDGMLRADLSSKKGAFVQRADTN